VIKHFVIHQGYVEDQSMACVTLSHVTGFSTPEEGMEAWYQFLLARAGERVPRPKPCCKATFDKHADPVG